MIDLVRVALVLVAVTACSFDRGAASTTADAAPEGPDGRPLFWTKDSMSGISCPANIPEWVDFIAGKHLTIAQPDGVWLMQDGVGDLAPAAGGISIPYPAGG